VVSLLGDNFDEFVSGNRIEVRQCRCEAVEF